MPDGITRAPIVTPAPSPSSPIPAPDVVTAAPPPALPPGPDMLWIPGGTYRMGSDRYYPEEAPSHRVTVDGFWMDRFPVTNERFQRFVEATGYVTLAELPPNPADYPKALREMLHPASMVFVKPPIPVPVRDGRDWRCFLRGADWRHPQGPLSSIAGIERHPVVHVAWADAVAFAQWEGRTLPTEAEWERAARGGLVDAEYAWGDDFAPGGHMMANTWQGEFPWQNLRTDGWEGTSPVDAFPPNGYGVHDMIGNVWEWTADWWAPRHEHEPAKACAVARSPRGPHQAASYDPTQLGIRIPRKVLKGGSFLSAPNYCRRYRPAARCPEAIDTTASYVGFRCIARAAGTPAPDSAVSCAPAGSQG